MLGMFGIRIMSGNQLLNGYANGITPNVSGVYEVGAFNAQMFIQPQKFNGSTKAECLIVSPNFINTLLAVVAVVQG